MDVTATAGCVLLGSLFLVCLLLLAVTFFAFEVVRSLFPAGLDVFTTRPDFTGFKKGTCSCRKGRVRVVP